MDGKRKATKGVDAISILTQSAHAGNEQLRAAAITRMNTLRADIATATGAADEAYRAKEQEYLQAVAAWRQATDAQERGLRARLVGTLQKDLTALDERRQAARFPHRYVQMQDLFRTVIDADTRDTRKIPHPVFVERTATTSPTERSIQLL